MAVLAQLLIAYGNMAGSEALRRVGATRHHTNEFVLLVGLSAKGRKGSSVTPWATRSPMTSGPRSRAPPTA